VCDALWLEIVVGASMEDNSMLSEHTLLTSGDVADAGKVYVGWPAKVIPDSTLDKNESDADAK
jgi:carbonic anhydrase/acetyltransferase-like protein (isoleucine patch superfamily)